MVVSYLGGRDQKKDDVQLIKQRSGKDTVTNTQIRARIEELHTQLGNAGVNWGKSALDHEGH